jgi:catechol 2,3-dioxygenase-like lactoylglutathione lyase family enzyme
VKLVREALDAGLVVVDLDAAVAFYVGVLGLEELNRMPVPGVGDLVVVGVGRSRLRLIQLTRGPRRRAEPGGVRAGASGLRYLALEVADLDGQHAACARAGVTVLMVPTTVGPTRVCQLADPDGNAVELMERLP